MPTVFRLRPSGTPEGPFDVAGAPGEAHAVVPVGSAFLVAGWRAGAQREVFFVARRNEDGSPDVGFGTRGVAEADFGVAARAFAMAVDTAGRIVLAGRAGSQLALARSTAAGAPDAGFGGGEPVTFDAVGSSDPAGEPLRYAFDLDGNGSFELDGAENPLALRSFDAPGAHVVGVRVSDPRGASSLATRSVTIEAGPPRPRPLLGKRGVAKPLRGIVRLPA